MGVDVAHLAVFGQGGHRQTHGTLATFPGRRNHIMPI
ncbi:hypothetical protein SHM7688_03547 [Shimia marina]|uniref:Uncharacterized protein n=1 Tax=Shimia marina TaxID=321267 RepID=A0A0P1EUE1_9RHOB|nr:hypothetical protein SHM7688_03547 [Shimia marina]